MDLPGLITLRPDQTDEIERLSNMMGVSFLEELWTAEWLSALDVIGTTKQRKLSISQAIIRYNLTLGAPYQAGYMLSDYSAGAGGYLQSELGSRTWEEIEEESTTLMGQEVLTKEERPLLKEKADSMKAISDFNWMERHTKGEDFIHFYALGVDANARGTGAFRRLMTPFLDYADDHGIACYLECYSTRLVGLYGHFGFEVVNELCDPAFEIVEYCMERKPQANNNTI